MIVRYAKVEEAIEISKIIVDGWKTAYRGIISDKYLDELDYKLRAEKLRDGFDIGYMMVCEDETNNEILGICKFGDRQDIEDNKYKDYDGEIVALYVKSEIKRKGIGRKIFNTVKDELKKMGKKKLIIWCLRDNISSRKFYETIGGKIVGEKYLEIEGIKYPLVGFGYEL